MSPVIKIPDDVKDDLQRLKVIEDEPYWKVIKRLIDRYQKTHKPSQ